ncbi:30S ribosome-binding factor RbfA [Mycoplasmopsis cynos]|nr:30S ribosome-binding factor RbfA [Mycoplasmopsis cynos]WAM10418.1 30S ribosome-binding factor RbfA [Mycoplasmopsis cynos]
MNQISLRKKKIKSNIWLLAFLMRDITNVNIQEPVVMDVKLSSDLSYLKVFVTFSGNEQKGIIALNNSALYVRKILAKSLDWRKVPEVKFYLDEVTENGSRIDQILREIQNQK